jgi:L-lactate dehydrogenase complex protein LldE
MRIALFNTCLTGTLCPETGNASTALRARLGHEVAFPPGQGCDSINSG